MLLEAFEGEEQTPAWASIPILSLITEATPVDLHENTTRTVSLELHKLALEQTAERMIQRSPALDVKCVRKYHPQVEAPIVKCASWGLWWGSSGQP